MPKLGTVVGPAATAGRRGQAPATWDATRSDEGWLLQPGMPILA
jgi:hypothetical protein